jgi:hypothetical protein
MSYLTLIINLSNVKPFFGDIFFLLVGVLSSKQKVKLMLLIMWRNYDPNELRSILCDIFQSIESNGVQDY